MVVTAFQYVRHNNGLRVLSYTLEKLTSKVGLLLNWKYRIVQRGRSNKIKL